eukprot:COSAG06_NODE_2922_length_6086_cov_12.303658_3_plen_153_part_00
MGNEHIQVYAEAHIQHAHASNVIATSTTPRSLARSSVVFPSVESTRRGRRIDTVFLEHAAGAGGRCLRTVFWGAASLSMPFLLFEQTQSAAVVGVFQLVSNLCAMLAMLTFGSISDRGGLQRRRLVTLGSLLALAVCSALLALAVSVDSPVS